MGAIRVVAVGGAVLLGTLGAAEARAQLATVEEAQRISEETGRPIFALAGRET